MSLHTFSLSVGFVTGVLALLLALAIDLTLGEPRARWHPVVWIGNYLQWAGQRVPRRAGECLPDYTAFWLAALYWCAGCALFVIAFWVVDRLISTLAWPLSVLLLGMLLKPLLAWAMLKNEVLAVEAALNESLEAGRQRLSWLVSRDVSQLSAVQVRESAIESLAENLNDSVVAPIFWFVLLGLPGAVLYRFANTADAMWGYPGVYRGQNWQWAGKWAARADDLLNWLPARLTGALLAGVARVSLRALYPQSRLTPSPNSGWPMAAMALALEVSLGKPGVYRLNATALEPSEGAVKRAIEMASKTLVVFVTIACCALYMLAIGEG